jgi:hypothetical protein
MKKTFILTILITVFIVSCSKNQDENTYSISDKHEYEVQSEVVFAAEGKDSLNIFYDLAIRGSFIIVTDMTTDTLVRIYENINFSNCLFKWLKGNGPIEFIDPVLISKSADYDTIVIYEINSRRIKTIYINENNKIENIKSEFSDKKIPYIDEPNITENYIIGIDVADYKLSIYNKNSYNLNKVNYYPEADKEYDEERLKSLYLCRLVANEQKQSLCSSLFSINCINFYNLEGQLQKTIIIGDKLYFPKPHPVFLDFAQEKIYFSGISGTDDYVYCLYRGVKSFETITDNVLIFIFNWKGEHITTIQTNGNIWKIAADKDNKYLLGISSRDNGSTDIVKIPLEGMI